MEIEEFKHRLTQATKNLLEFTQGIVINNISLNIEYVIEPNQRGSSNHLTTLEIEKLAELNGYADQLLSFKEVVDLLHSNNTVPLWVNTEISKSQTEKTVIKLICSRRFRSKKELNDKANKFPPFHPLIPTPPNWDSSSKFDVNWRHPKKKQSFILRLFSK